MIPFLNQRSPNVIKFISQRGLAKDYATSTFAANPPSINAYTVGSVSVTITEISVGDIVNVYRPSTMPAGLVIAGVEIASAGTLTLYLGNITSAAIDSAELTFRYQWIDLT